MSKIVISLIISFLCITNILANSAVKVSYEIIPISENEVSKLKIKVEFKGDKSGITKIQLPTSFGGQEDLYKSINNLKAVTPSTELIENNNLETKTIKHLPNQQIMLEYDLIQDWNGVPQAGSGSQDSGGGYRPILQKDYFHFLGSGGFVLPVLKEENKLKVSILWKSIPTNWTLANSFGASQTKQKFSTTMGKLYSSVFVGGDFQITKRTVKGKSVFTAIRGKWKFTNDDFANLAEKIIAVERDFWKDYNQPYYLITLIPLEAQPNALSIGGTGLTNSFATFVTPNATLENLTFLISHEYFHNWNSPKLGGLADPEQKLYWFSEGFTDYYTYLLLLRSGLFDLEKYIAQYNKTLSEYYLSPYKNISNQQLADDFFKSYGIGQVAYWRGFLLATKWNQIILEQNNGKKSLDDLMREIFGDAKTNKYGKLSKERIIAYLNKYAKHNFAEDIEKYIERGQTIDNFQGSLGKCFETSEIQIGKFELGFDYNTLVKENKISGILPNSAAYQAGLRDGQKVVGRSLYYNNPNQQVEITIDENGEKKKFTYLPATEEKILTPQFKIKDNLSPEERKNCLQ